ncbi:MAG: hypothetical protein RR533_08020 [Carnobacterium sp.]
MNAKKGVDWFLIFLSLTGCIMLIIGLIIDYKDVNTFTFAGLIIGLLSILFYAISELVGFKNQEETTKNLQVLITSTKNIENQLLNQQSELLKEIENLKESMKDVSSQERKYSLLTINNHSCKKQNKQKINLPRH